MSFELTPLAKRIFLKGYEEKTTPRQQQSYDQTPMFNTGFYQMPTFNQGFGYDSFYSMLFTMQNMMNAFNMPYMQQPSFDFSGFNTTIPDYSYLFQLPDFNFDTSINTNSAKPNAKDKFVPNGNVKSYDNHKYSNMSVTTPYTGTAEELNKQLQGKGLLEGKGEKLLELQKKYGVNAAFIAAIARAESGGTSKLARENNNLTGITNPGGHGFRKFNSVDECLEYTAKLIKTNYIDKNLTTIAQIHKKYCPIGANNDPNKMNNNWGFVVGSCMNQMMA